MKSPHRFFGKGILAAVAASLGSVIGLNRTVVEHKPEAPYSPPDSHAGPPRYRPEPLPPRPKRAKRRRTLHADKATRYLRFCWSAKPWGALTPVEHAHGAQRRNAAIIKNTGYEQRSRHVGTRWAGPARDTDDAGELAGLSLR